MGKLWGNLAWGNYGEKIGQGFTKISRKKNTSMGHKPDSRLQKIINLFSIFFSPSM